MAEFINRHLRLRTAMGIFCALLLSLVISTEAGRLAAADIELKPNKTIVIEAKLLHPTINTRDGYLYWLNLTEGKLERASLATKRLDPNAVRFTDGPRDFCLSADGRTAYVIATPNNYSRFREIADQHGTIHIVDLKSMGTISTMPVPIDPYSIVCDRAGKLFISQGSGQHGNLYQIDPNMRSIVWISPWSLYESSHLRLTSARAQIYMADGSAMQALPLFPNMKDSSAPSRAPSQSGHFSGGAFEISPDDRYAISQAGNVVQLRAGSGLDMQFVAELEENLAFACDPARGRLWLLDSPNGNLVTCQYPEFKFLKTEYLANHGEALIYDATQKTLWVVRSKEKCKHGGLDIYDLSRVTDNPAPALDQAATDASPANPGKFQPHPAYSLFRDPVFILLLGVSALMLFATAFIGWSAWPLPTSLKFIGWFGWFQAVLLFAMIISIASARSGMSATFSIRAMSGLATILGGLSWGILRGNRICFVVYAILLVGGTLNNLSHGSVPTFLGIILIFSVLFYGRKHWDRLL